MIYDLNTYKSLCNPMTSVNIKYYNLSKQIVNTLTDQVNNFLSNQKTLYFFNKKNKIQYNF